MKTDTRRARLWQNSLGLGSQNGLDLESPQRSLSVRNHLSYFCRRTINYFDCKTSLIEPGFFRTQLTNEGRIAECWSQSWKNSAPEIKAEYGEKYVKHGKRIFLTLDSFPYQWCLCLISANSFTKHFLVGQNKCT